LDWIAEYNNKQLSILKELSDKEEIRIKSATKRLNELLIVNDSFSNLDITFKEYEFCCIFCLDDDKKIVIAINNYLGHYKCFVDGWETYLKRNKNEILLKEYKEALSAIYDQNFEYRFIYNLRNYTQHCGKPISSCSQSVNNEFELIMDRDIFLAEHTGIQGPFKKELQRSGDPKLDVDKAIRRVHELLIELQNKLLTEMARSDYSFLSAAVQIAKFYNTYNLENGDLYLLNYEEINRIKELNKCQDETELSMFRLPIQLARLVIKGTHIKFEFTGKNIGHSNSFPMLFEPKYKASFLKFKTGKQSVISKGIKWIRVVSSTGWVQNGSYDEYFAVYIPEGLTIDEYSNLAEKFEKEINWIINKN
jgi:hypothetical protein